MPFALFLINDFNSFRFTDKYILFYYGDDYDTSMMTITIPILY